MLDKLIESKNNVGANKRLSSLLLSTFTIVTSVLGVGLLYSLFTFNLAMGSENLEVSTLLAPIIDTEQAPPEKVAPVKKQQSEKTISDLPSRQENIQRPDETPVDVPKNISVMPTTQKSRPNSAFKIGPDDFDPTAASSSGANERSGGGGGSNPDGVSNELKPQTTSQNAETEIEPVIKQTKKFDLPLKKITTVSKGVINGQAKDLVKPAYPQTAKAVGASGEVKVQVTIDEEGRVISAVAVSGHSLLKQAAVNAARSSTFTPTYLSQQKVKVTGIIIYNFAR